MSTALIIVIIVVAVLIVAGGFAARSPRARVARRERELGKRRDHAVETHRAEADVREQRAAEAEKRAQVANAEAQRERAEAELHHSRAGLHEQGLADRELVNPDEREHFAGTSAVQEQERESDRTD